MLGEDEATYGCRHHLVLSNSRGARDWNGPTTGLGDQIVNSQYPTYLTDEYNPCTIVTH